MSLIFSKVDYSLHIYLYSSFLNGLFIFFAHFSITYKSYFAVRLLIIFLPTTLNLFLFVLCL